MKRRYFFATFILTLLFIEQNFAQTLQGLDESPLDITYLRPNKLSTPLIKVIYGRPKKQSDIVFGNQVPFDKIWRTGDNEATEVTFYSDVKVGNKLIKSGTYVLHTIPGKKEWTIILNSNTDTWGAFFYDESKDIARIRVTAKQAEELDVFSIFFKQNYNNTFMVLAWDTTRVNIPIEINSQILAEL